MGISMANLSLLLSYLDAQRARVFLQYCSGLMENEKKSN